MTAFDELAALVEIAERAEITGIGWRSLSRFYDLPEDVSGLRVLDICAGMSDFAANLGARGARAIAVDIAFADLRDLRYRHRLNFEATAQHVFHVGPRSAESRQIYDSFVQGFESTVGTGACAYVAASATRLPFPEETFDLVTSFNGIFGTMDFDAGLLGESLIEALRVVKTGGSVQLIPFQNGPVLEDAELRNQDVAVRELERIPGLELIENVARVDELLGGEVTSLTIRKLPL